MIHDVAIWELFPNSSAQKQMIIRNSVPNGIWVRFVY